MYIVNRKFYLLLLMVSPLLNDFKRFFKSSTALHQLIIVNVAVFAVLKLLYTFLFLFNIQESIYQPLIKNLAVPANVKTLLFRPWSIFTYMFVHEGFMHILFNMLWLWWLGNIFYEYLGGKKLVFTYIAGGLSGAVLYILAFNIFPVFQQMLPFSYAMGASAGILAVVVGIATLLPSYRIGLMFIGAVPLKYIALFSVVLDVLSISHENPGGHIAHLGGALFGYLYIKQLKKGQDIGEYFYGLFAKVNSFPFTRKKMKVAFKQNQTKTDEAYLANKKERQEIIDAILDKIAQSGYESLTKGEKETLFKASKEN